MQHDYDNLLKSLANMSAEELNKSARDLARTEKQHAARLICHLAEIMSRKLYLEYGYANIFEYCVQRLGFSEGATHLRRQVAYTARRFPQLLEAIADLRISVSVAAKIAPHLTKDNVARVLVDCAGMTKRQAETYAVTLAPKPVVQPGIRRQPSAARATAGTPAPAAFQPQPHPQDHGHAAGSRSHNGRRPGPAHNTQRVRPEQLCRPDVARATSGPRRTMRRQRRDPICPRQSATAS